METFSKVKNLAQEIASSKSYENGGGILIICSNPENPNENISFLNGKGLNLLAMLTAVLSKNKDFAHMFKDALFMSSLIPEGLVNEKAEE